MRSGHDPSHEERREARRGVAYGMAAYLLWGLFPIFFKQLADVAPLEVLAHRIIWSLFALTIFVTAITGWRQVLATFRHRQTLLILCCTTLLIGTNWFLFIMAVEGGQILQSSLGYFINPLVSVLLGFLFLKERLRRNQIISLILASIGVLVLTIHHGSLPWIALVLAATFGTYGLLRKVAAVQPLPGLFVETLLLFPAAMGFLLWHAANRGIFLNHSTRTSMFLCLSGVITAIPLLWFAASTRRLQLATVGFMQYITPTMHFLCAVVIYKEPFSAVHLSAFACIWIGLALYSYDAARMLINRRRWG